MLPSPLHSQKVVMFGKNQSSFSSANKTVLCSMFRFGSASEVTGLHPPPRLFVSKRFSFPVRSVSRHKKVRDPCTSPEAAEGPSPSSSCSEAVCVGARPSQGPLYPTEESSCCRAWWLGSFTQSEKCQVFSKDFDHRRTCSVCVSVISGACLMCFTLLVCVQSKNFEDTLVFVP